MLEVISFHCAVGGCISSSLETPVFSKTLYPGDRGGWNLCMRVAHRRRLINE